MIKELKELLQLNKNEGCLRLASFYGDRTKRESIEYKINDGEITIIVSESIRYGQKETSNSKRIFTGENAKKIYNEFIKPEL